LAADTLSATQQHNGIVQWGYSQEEENAIKNDPSYAVLENSKILEDSGKEDDIKDEYAECYEKSMGTLLSESKIKREESGAVKADDSKCSPKSLGMHNPDYGDLVFRWRLKGMYENTLDHFAEIQNPEEDTANAGNTGTPGDLPDGVVGPEDIVDILPWLGEGRGCHKNIATQVRQMLEAADKDGVHLTGNCWRSSETQIALRQQNCPDPVNSPSSDCHPPTAKPGTSNHERGLAIDFNDCSSSSDCFKWLSAHAATYHFQNLPSESWHWSVDGR
jgi:hypothetical protein